MWTPDPSIIITAEDKAARAKAAKHAAINTERDRRILDVSLLDAGDYGPMPVSGDPTTQLNLLALKDTARDLKAAMVTAAVIPFRDAENVDHLLTADQMIALVDAGKERVQSIYSASWAIKAMDPLPEDVTADELWPLPTRQA